MGKLVALFLLSDGMGQFLEEKLEYINIFVYLTMIFSPSKFNAETLFSMQNAG